MPLSFFKPTIPSSISGLADIDVFLDITASYVARAIFGAITDDRDLGRRVTRGFALCQGIFSMYLYRDNTTTDVRMLE